MAFRITSERKKEREIERQRVTQRERERERTSSSDREFVGTVVWFCLWLLESPQKSDREREEREESQQQ